MLESLEDDSLMEHISRKLGETLVANNLLLAKMWRVKELANEEVLQIVLCMTSANLYVLT